MITTYNNTLYGLSTDDKPNNANNGTLFHEIDTSKDFMYDAENEEWYEQSFSNGGGLEFFVVTFERDTDLDTYIPNVTIQEAIAAIESGKTVIFKFHQEHPFSITNAILPSFQDNDHFEFDTNHLHPIDGMVGSAYLYTWHGYWYLDYTNPDSPEEKFEFSETYKIDAYQD